MPDDKLKSQLEALRKEYSEVEASLPKHSVPASILVRLEDLEEQIEDLEKLIAAENK